MRLSEPKLREKCLLTFDKHLLIRGFAIGAELAPSTPHTCKMTETLKVIRHQATSIVIVFFLRWGKDEKFARNCAMLFHHNA